MTRTIARALAIALVLAAIGLVSAYQYRAQQEWQHDVIEYMASHPAPTR